MKYQGSKSRIASDIIPIMLEAFSKNNCEIFIDCCVGGGNLLDKIPHSIERYGNDSNEYLIEMWKAVSNGWIPPKIITENDYYNIRDNKDDNKALTGYVGFALYYGGKWFGGWSRGKDNKGNDILLHRIKNIKSQREHFDLDLLEDVEIELRQAQETTNIYSDILTGTMDAYASVISNNMNTIMKQMTSISIILMIPTLIASLYGMNVPNDLQENKYGIWIVIAISMILSAFGVFLFKRKRWF